MAEKHQCEQNYLDQLSDDLTNEVDACVAVEKAIAARDNCTVAALPLNEDVLRIMFFSYCTKRTQQPTKEEQCLIEVSLEAALELQTIKQLSVPILSEACCVLTKTIKGANACPNGVTKEQLLKMFNESYATRCAGSSSQSPTVRQPPTAHRPHLLRLQSYQRSQWH
uniref:Uncharacterized protein n=1 Tax=Ditylenchus dipsaci TaxID=166011 RepID=A0A915D0Z0_9BILA